MDAVDRAGISVLRGLKWSGQLHPGCSVAGTIASMSPLLHYLVGFLVSCLGAVTGLIMCVLLWHADGLNLFGSVPFPFNLLDGAVVFFVMVGGGFLGVLTPWIRYIPAQCPRCGGRGEIARGPRRPPTF